jgi:hypothetical protein
MAHARFRVGHLFHPQTVAGLVLIVVVVMIHVMMLRFMVVRAIALYLFQLLVTPVRLFAVFTVLLNRFAQLVLCCVNAPFTARAVFVPIIRPSWQGRPHQADNSQHCHGKNSDTTSHMFSFIEFNLEFNNESSLDRCDKRILKQTKLCF